MTRVSIVLPLLLVLLLASCAFLTGFTWGLPSRDTDAFLFGDRQPWTGAKIIELTSAARDTSRGADVDATPIDRSQPAVVNATDADRAAIVRRYRLYSYQPDEMNTLMALAAMRPGQGDLDPKMYKYGGLWVYPVGALLQVSAKLGLITLRSDLAYYLDHPEAFGRFYLVARAYAVGWALVGVGAVFFIGLRLTGKVPAAVATAGGFALLPVVITQAHEAKPHLPGLVLVLLAVLAADACVRTGKRRYWVLTGLLTGSAVGMVVSTWPVFLLLPLVAMLREGPRLRRAVAAVVASLVGVATYFATNPYVLINLFRDRDLLRNHFRNTADFYTTTTWLDGLGAGLLLVLEGASPMVVLFAALALASLVMTRRATTPSPAPVSPPATHPRVLVALLSVPAAVTLLQFLALAGGQPADYARFALLPAVGLLLGGVWFVSRFESQGTRALLWLALLLPTTVHGSLYLRGFVRDAAGPSSRTLTASLMPIPVRGDVLAVYDEPAPYSLPPVNLWDWQIVLQPRGTDAPMPEAYLSLRRTERPAASTWTPDVGGVLIGSPLLARTTRISHAGRTFEWFEQPPP